MRSPHTLVIAASLFTFVAVSGAGVAAACKEQHRCKNKPDVAVTLSVDGNHVATIVVKNVSKRTLTLPSHVQTHELHYDWLAVGIGYPSAKKCAPPNEHASWRTLSFVDDRDKSTRITVDLAPGRSFTHRIDLDAWARRAVNGGAPLAAGYSTIVATYDTSRETDAWSGKVSSNTLRFGQRDPDCEE